MRYRTHRPAQDLLEHLRQLARHDDLPFAERGAQIVEAVGEPPGGFVDDERARLVGETVEESPPRRRPRRDEALEDKAVRRQPRHAERRRHRRRSRNRLDPHAGGNRGAILNAADEMAVAAFLAGRISFPRIAETIASAVEEQSATTQEMDRGGTQAATGATEISGHIAGVAAAPPCRGRNRYRTAPWTQCENRS